MKISESITRAAIYCNSMNIPNFLTILRVIAIPFFIVALSYHYNGIALAIFFGCGVTDALDGFIARTCHQRTKIGAFLDPTMFMLETKYQIAPTKIGKLTTFLQVTLIIVVLFYNYQGVYHPNVILPLCWLTFVVTVISGLGYIYQGIQLLNDNPDGEKSSYETKHSH